MCLLLSASMPFRKHWFDEDKTMANVTSLIIGDTPCAIGVAHHVRAAEKTSERVFVAVCMSLFLGSTVATVLWCNDMSAMPGMPMPGGWTMSMAWMRMPGQTWAGAAASFVEMWGVMMMAMMLPSITPMLWRNCSSFERHRGRMTTLVGCGYFLVWTLLGLIIFAVGAFIAAIEMARPDLARALPAGQGMIVLIAGVLQFTQKKLHHLSFCRDVHPPSGARPPQAWEACRYGARFGIHCGVSCANLTAIFLVLGVMDLRAMAAATAAITAERLAPARMRLPEAIGAVSILLGLIMIARAARLA